MIAITAPTWWRATKEASCIVCQECREKLRHGGHRLHYCEHMRTRSTAPPRLVLRHRLPSAFTVTMVQWICTVGLQETHRRWGERGGVVIAIFSSTLLTICKSQSKKKCIKMLLKKKKKKSSPIRFAITSWDMKPVAKLNAVQLWYTENRANGCGNTLKKPIVVY